MKLPFPLLPRLHCSGPFTRAAARVLDDPSRLALMLYTYVKWSSRLRTLMTFGLPVFFVFAMVFSGPLWPWIAAAMVALLFSWPWLLGARPLSERGRNHLKEFISQSRMSGLIDYQLIEDWDVFYEKANEDTISLANLVLSPSGRSQVQAKWLGAALEDVEPRTKDVPVRRL